MKPLSEMSNDEFFNYVVEQNLKGWIPLGTYLRLFPEETREAIEVRIKRGYWKRGVHCNRPLGSHLWVNLTAIGEWAAGSGRGQ